MCERTSIHLTLIFFIFLFFQVEVHYIFSMARLKIINWYIFKELIGPFFVSLLTFSAIMMMGRTLKLADLLVNKGLDILEVVKLLTYIMVPFLGYIIPMSLLLTILLGLGRLSADGEIIAIKSSGISLYQIIFPIGVFVSMQHVIESLGQRRVFKHRPIGHMQHFAGVKVIQNSGQIGIRQLRNGRQPVDFSRHMIALAIIGIARAAKPENIPKQLGHMFRDRTQGFQVTGDAYAVALGLPWRF